MCIISVLMPVSNNEKYVHDAIKSVLKQSFVDFELIILNFGSTDNTLSVVRAFNDKRIRVAEASPNRIKALNLGLELALGKYVALMEAESIMHVDRLKIQYAVMETEPTIIVCGTGIKRIGEATTSENDLVRGPVGLIENPLLAFLRGNYIVSSTVMLRKAFLIEYGLRYEEGGGIEDFKLWCDIAKQGGQILIENQSLLYSRLCEDPENKPNSAQQQKASEEVINEVIEYLIGLNKAQYPELETLLEGFNKLREKELLIRQDIALFFSNLFIKNKDKLVNSCKP